MPLDTEAGKKFFDDNSRQLLSEGTSKFYYGEILRYSLMNPDKGAALKLVFVEQNADHYDERGDIKENFTLEWVFSSVC